jgi:hypothetical protein
VSLVQYVVDIFLLGGIIFSNIEDNLTPRDLVNRPEYITLPYALNEGHFHPSYTQNPNLRNRCISKCASYRNTMETSYEKMYLNQNLNQTKFTTTIMTCTKMIIDIWYLIDRSTPRPPQSRISRRSQAEPQQLNQDVS